MTIITAMAKLGMLAIGHNNGSTLGDTRLVDGGSKWIFFGKWALGISGEGSVQTMLEHRLQEIDAGTDNPKNLIRHIKKLLIENDIWMKAEGDSSMSFAVSCLLVNREGRVWDLDNRFALTEIPDGVLWARGSGMDYALGAAFALRTVSQALSVEEQVRIATEAAIAMDIYSVGDAVVATL